MKAVQVTKLDFSQEEIDALKNSHFFTVKKELTHKIIEIFGKLEAELKAEIQNFDLSDIEGINIKSGKIFRGENYQNLPYIVLDYPRLFNSKSVFAFRSMLWWGNEFSFTLHLQGVAWEQRKNNLIANLENLRDKGLYICVNDTPWQYHFGTDNYIEIEKFLDDGRRGGLHEKTFIKLSSRLPLEDYRQCISFSLDTIKILLKIL